MYRDLSELLVHFKENKYYIRFKFETILVDVHENVTYKYVEVNPTGKKDIRRQTQEGSQASFPSGGAKATPAAMFLPSLIDR